MLRNSSKQDKNASRLATRPLNFGFCVNVTQPAQEEIHYREERGKSASANPETPSRPSATCTMATSLIANHHQGRYLTSQILIDNWTDAGGHQNEVEAGKQKER
jgi:hypothetical protein